MQDNFEIGDLVTYQEIIGKITSKVYDSYSDNFGDDQIYIVKSIYEEDSWFVYGNEICIKNPRNCPEYMK